MVMALGLASLLAPAAVLPAPVAGPLTASARADVCVPAWRVRRLARREWWLNRRAACVACREVRVARRVWCWRW